MRKTVTKMHDGPADGWPESHGQEQGADKREPADAANGQLAGGSLSPRTQAGLWAAQGESADDDDPASELGLRTCLEAILLVADEPVAENLLAQIVERPTSEVAATLRELSDDYTAERRGFDLREVAGGWRFYTRAECAGIVERFVSDGQEVRLTQAALETLAVVAYRQPVSRARVSAVRGVNCDGVMRTLVLRGLVEEGGTDVETGAILFQTTSYFLERLGLARLSDLPDLAPFLPDQLDDELDPGNEPGR
jgi:segregation and condensation protein B